MSIFHTAILFILLFLSYIHVLNILTWPIALYQLIAYVLFTFLIIPTAYLFRGQSRSKFDFEKNKEAEEEIKKPKRKVEVITVHIVGKEYLKRLLNVDTVVHGSKKRNRFPFFFLLLVNFN